jgi:hypothetical protein
LLGRGFARVKHPFVVLLAGRRLLIPGSLVRHKLHGKKLIVVRNALFRRAVVRDATFQTYVVRRAELAPVDPPR